QAEGAGVDAGLAGARLGQEPRRPPEGDGARARHGPPARGLDDQFQGLMAKKKHTNGHAHSPTNVVRHLFGTDGIRGTANVGPITPEIALALGKAVAHVAGRNKTHTPRILIGKDTRLSGYMIEQALASGICSMGGRVILCGPLPTPAVAQLTVSMRAD